MALVNDIVKPIVSAIVKPIVRFVPTDLGEKLLLDFAPENATVVSGDVTEINDSTANAVVLSHFGTGTGATIEVVAGVEAFHSAAGDNQYQNIVDNTFLNDFPQGEVFMIYRATEYTNVSNILFSVGDGGETTQHLSFDVKPGTTVNNDSNVTAKLYNTTSGTNFNSKELRANAWNLVSMACDGTLTYMRRDGYSLPLQTPTNIDRWFPNVSFPPINISLFGRVCPGVTERRAFQGYIARVIVTDQLTDDERDDVFGYLQSQFPVYYFGIVGDSISNNNTDWPGRFVAIAAVDNSTINPITWASGGDNTVAIDSQFDTNISGKSYSLFGYLGGINDIIADSSATTIFANISETVGKAQAEGLTTVLFTVLPFGSNVDHTSARQTELISLNVLIRDFAAANTNIFLVDAYEIMRDGIDLAAAFDSGDGLHPNSTGSTTLAQSAYDAIKDNLPVFRAP